MCPTLSAGRRHETVLRHRRQSGARRDLLALTSSSPGVTGLAATRPAPARSPAGNIDPTPTAMQLQLARQLPAGFCMARTANQPEPRSAELISRPKRDVHAAGPSPARGGFQRGEDGRYSAQTSAAAAATMPATATARIARARSPDWLELHPHRRIGVPARPTGLGRRGGAVRAIPTAMGNGSRACRRKRSNIWVSSRARRVSNTRLLFLAPALLTSSRRGSTE